MLNEKKLNRLNLENFHIENGAKLIPFSNYNMPINYKNGIISEHNNTRNSCGLFDVSHMLQLEINATNDNTKKLEKIIPLDLNNHKLWKSSYSFILNNEGGIIDDLIISKLLNNFGDPIYYLVLNASRRNKDLKVISEILNNKKEINEKKQCNLFAIQGPNSRKIISKIIPNTNKLRFMEINNFKFDNTNILVSCSGYTGEDGFEISINKNISINLIKKILENKEVSLCGLGCRDILRLEAGLCLYGNELNENTKPNDVNLMWAISKNRLKNKDFIGAKYICNNSNNKVRVGLISNNNSIPRSNFEVFDNQNKLIGNITSGSFSPSLKKPIAMAIIEKNFSNINTEIFIKNRGNMEPATVSKIPFISHKYKK